MYRESMQLHKTSDWCEEMGDCIFLHFDDMSSPPTVMCGSPRDGIFVESFWTHFICPDFNNLFDQIQSQE